MHPRPCLGPSDPWFRVRARSRRSRPDQVYYWEGTLQLLFHKLCLKMIDHGSRSTCGLGPSRYGLWAQKYYPPTKMVLPYNFGFIKSLPSLTVEAIDAPQTLFRALWPRGVGYRVKTILRTFSPSKYIPMPNFTQIVQISIRYEYIYIYNIYIIYVYIYIYIYILCVIY